MLQRNGHVEIYLAKQMRRDEVSDFKVMLKREQARISPEKAAVDAWDAWLKRAPAWWRAAYWKAKGEPWRDPCLSDAERYRLRYRLDASFQIKERLRRQLKKRARRDGIAETIRGALRRGGNSPTVERVLGYSIDDLRKHLERQFTRGMTWEKFLSGSIHIDHIVPQSAFDLNDEDDWRRCWCMSNLRPLWAKDNATKRDKRVFLL